MRCVGVVPPYVNKISPLEPFSLHCLKQLSPHYTRLTTYVDAGTCTIVVFQETHAHAIDEIDLLWGYGMRLLRNYYIVPRPKLQCMDRKCLCGRGTAAALNALLAEYYPFQLSVSVFHFSFPFQLSFPPFPLALIYDMIMIVRHGGSPNLIVT